MHVNEKEILEAALLGYQEQIRKLQNKMRDVEDRLHPAVEIVGAVRLALKTKRKFSAESLAAMSAAAKKRWRLLKRDAA